eukprot:14259256-Ditylum_brightwellii.AAC.1
MEGAGNFKLDQIVAHYRNLFVTMQQCAEYVKFQLSNELSRPDGKMYDFERTAAFIIPSDLVARKIKDNKAGTTVEVYGFHSGGRGGAAQGVELRFHKMSEYSKLLHKQKGELMEWHKKVKCKKSNQNGGGGLTEDSLDDNESSKEPEPAEKTGNRKKVVISSSVKSKVGKSSLCGILKTAKTEKDN